MLDPQASSKVVSIDGSPLPELLPSLPEGSSRPLAERVADLVSNVKEKLEKGEMPNREYSDLVFSEAKACGILSGDYGFENAGNVGKLMFLLEKKLDIQTLKGLETDYYALKESPVSGAAQQDIKGYGELKDATEKFLGANFPFKRIEEKAYDQAVRKFVEGWLADERPGIDCQFRTASLAGAMMGSFHHRFEFVKSKPAIGEFSFEQVEDEFDRL